MPIVTLTESSRDIPLRITAKHYLGEPFVDKGDYNIKCESLLRPAYESLAIPAVLYNQLVVSGSSDDDAPSTYL